jgi:hypothetical protein
MRRLRSRIGCFAVVVGLTCAGCTPATQWTKAGATDEQLAQDLRVCNETAGQWGAAPYFDPRQGQIVSGQKDASQTQAACMLRRGWTLAP